MCYIVSMCVYTWVESRYYNIHELTSTVFSSMRHHLSGLIEYSTIVIALDIADTSIII